MKKILVGLSEILTDKRELRDTLSFILGCITLIIGILILVNSNSFYHNFSGLLVMSAGLSNIIIAVIPIQKWRRIELASFVVVIYGLLKSKSIVAMSIGFNAMIYTIFLLGLWIIIFDWFKRKRGV